MKKIIASAVGLMLVGGVAATTASAVESQFGGYWRTRAYIEDNFSQSTASDNDTNNGIIDTRTRLYYTAKFNDNFKFVNKFEFDAAWGSSPLGDIGADGKEFEIKQSYADFTLGKVNTKVGIQYATISRGFLFGAEFAGIISTLDLGMVKLPLLYGALSTEDAGSSATVAAVTNLPGVAATFGAGDGDVHVLSFMPSIQVNDGIKITPHATWATVTQQDTDVYWLGVDADLKFDPVAIWATGIYNGGQVDNGAGVSEDDISAFLLAAGADASLGTVGVHGQAFYATGDDDATDNDIDSFVVISDGVGVNGASYYWAEILGYGTFDNDVPDGSIGDKITNIWALNAGVTVKPMDKLTFNFDVWYAQLAEEIAMPTAANPNNTEDELGLELDAKLSYELMDNLKADLVVAYLFAGEVVGPEDVIEAGAMLSLSF